VDKTGLLAEPVSRAKVGGVARLDRKLTIDIKIAVLFMQLRKKDEL
jgi:hypothetical protein